MQQPSRAADDSDLPECCRKRQRPPPLNLQQPQQLQDPRQQQQQLQDQRQQQQQLQDQRQQQQQLQDPRQQQQQLQDPRQQQQQLQDPRQQQLQLQDQQQQQLQDQRQQQQQLQDQRQQQQQMQDQRQQQLLLQDQRQQLQDQRQQDRRQQDQRQLDQRQQLQDQRQQQLQDQRQQQQLQQSQQANDSLSQTPSNFSPYDPGSPLSPTECITPPSQRRFEFPPASPVSPNYRGFQPPEASSPSREMVPCYGNELSPFDDSDEFSAIAGGPGSNYVIIEEEVVEEVPRYDPCATPIVLKRTRRRITRGRGANADGGRDGRDGQRQADQRAALESSLERDTEDPTGVDPNAQWRSDHYEWPAKTRFPTWVSELQQTDQIAFATCMETFQRTGRWPTSDALGPGPDAQQTAQGYVIKQGYPLPQWLEEARQRGDDFKVGKAFEYYARWGRWPRMR